MKPLHEQEFDEARQKLEAIGRNVDDFAFDVLFMEPDPDGGGMYTVRYEVSVTNRETGKSGGYIGGIGLDWVSVFEQEVSDGEFD